MCTQLPHQYTYVERLGGMLLLGSRYYHEHKHKKTTCMFIVITLPWMAALCFRSCLAAVVSQAHTLIRSSLQIWQPLHKSKLSIQLSPSVHNHGPLYMWPQSSMCAITPFVLLVGYMVSPMLPGVLPRQLGFRSYEATHTLNSKALSD